MHASNIASPTLRSRIYALFPREWNEYAGFSQRFLASILKKKEFFSGICARSFVSIVWMRGRGGEEEEGREGKEEENGKEARGKWRVCLWAIVKIDRFGNLETNSCEQLIHIFEEEFTSSTI